MRFGLAAAAIAGSFVVASTATPNPPTADACCRDGAGGDGDESGDSPTVTAWVVDATNGGVSPPSGTSSCTRWEATNTFKPDDTSAPQADIPAESSSDGRVWLQWVRTCDGRAQVVWAPEYSPEDLARIALLEVQENLPAPTPATSPADDVGGFVTLETWLQVNAESDVSATAGPLPSGLTATTMATPSAIEWYPISGGQPTVCDLWGALPTEAQINSDADAPCGWLPPGPSAPQFGAGDNLRFNGEIVLVWTVAWTATNGTGGALGQLRSDTDWSYRVREIQTIGEDR